MAAAGELSAEALVDVTSLPVCPVASPTHGHSRRAGLASCVLCIHRDCHCVYTTHRKVGRGLVDQSSQQSEASRYEVFDENIPHLTFLCLQASQLSFIGVSSYEM